MDYVFEFYTDLKQCPVVKVHADYSTTQKNTVLFDNTQFVRTVKTIYSVRKDSAISCRKEMLEDE